MLTKTTTRQEYIEVLRPFGRNIAVAKMLAALQALPESEWPAFRAVLLARRAAFYTPANASQPIAA